MKALTMRRCAFGLSASVALLAGCGALPLSQPSPSLSKMQDDAQPMLPAATGADLLYATTNNSKYVYVMSYPKIRLVQRLGPFSESPPALCAGSGNVYVLVRGVNSKGNTIDVFKRGSTTVTRILQGFSGEWNCAADPTSGDLAVITFDERLGIYRHSRGLPHMYTLLKSYGMCSVAYGDAGELYFAAGSGHCGALEVYARGRLHYIKTDQRIGPGPLNIQWQSGKVVATSYAIGWPQDYRQNVSLIQPEAHYKAHVQSVAIDRRQREEPNQTDASCAVGDVLVAPDHDPGALDLWGLPQGGDPQRFARIRSINGYFTNIVLSTGS